MFNYKVYQNDGTFKFTINPKSVKSDVNFSANENGGQGQLSLSLDYTFENWDINNSDFIQIRKGINLIYTWVCQKVNRTITSDIQEINIPLLWLWTMPGYLLFYDAWYYVFTKNQDPAQTIKDIITWINSIYTWNWLNYDASSIPDYWSSQSFDFNYTNCLDAINTVAERIGWSWFIDKDGKVYFKPKNATSSHNLTVWKDIEQIKLSQDSEKLTNVLRLKYDSWVNVYTDATSWGIYWRRQIYIDKSDLTSAQADTFGNAYISDNKDPINKTTILLNKNYDIESIKILENITVKNFNYSINNLKIVKYQYSVDRLLIELEAFDSFGKELNL